MRKVWVRISPGLLKGYGFLRCYREDKAEARMKLCQTEMVEVDLLRKQWIGLEHRPEKSCRRDRFEADWLSKKMDASPRKNRCIYSSKGRSFGSVTQLAQSTTLLMWESRVRAPPGPRIFISQKVVAHWEVGTLLNLQKFWVDWAIGWLGGL